MMRQNPEKRDHRAVRPAVVVALVGVVGALVTTGCHHSYFAERAAMQVEEGKYARAIANYRAGLREATDTTEKRRIRVALRQTASMFAREEIKAAGTILANGMEEKAWSNLLGLRVLLPKLGADDETKQLVNEAIDRVAAVRWKQVELAIKAGDAEGALAIAAELASPLPTNSRTGAAYRKLRGAIAAHHLKAADAASGLPGAQLIYLQMARRHGAQVDGRLKIAQHGVDQQTAIA